EPQARSAWWSWVARPDPQGAPHSRGSPDRSRASGWRESPARGRSRRTIQVTKPPDAKPRDRQVAIGVFDGVHKGHQAVIDRADTVLTFDPHPLSVINPDAAPKLIMPFDVKRDVIDGLGVEELVVIPFD